MHSYVAVQGGLFPWAYCLLLQGAKEKLVQVSQFVSEYSSEMQSHLG